MKALIAAMEVNSKAARLQKKNYNLFQKSQHAVRRVSVAIAQLSLIFGRCPHASPAGKSNGVGSHQDYLIGFGSSQKDSTDQPLCAVGEAAVRYHALFSSLRTITPGSLTHRRPGSWRLPATRGSYWD